MSFWKRFFGTPNDLPEDQKPVVANDEIAKIEIDANAGLDQSDNSSENNEHVSTDGNEWENIEGQNEVEEESSQIVAESSQSQSDLEIQSKSEPVDVLSQKFPELNPNEALQDNLTTNISREESINNELEIAAQTAREAQLKIEKEEIHEDLSVLDGRILPQLKVPDWRQELEFVKERYEPCDLSEHIVKVSKRRLTARQIDHELAQSRLNAYERYLDRASRRFKDKIDEDALLNRAKVDLSQWKNEQAKSVAWVLADRVNDEVVAAKQAELDAKSFVENNGEFTNPSAISDYRYFARRMFLIPVTTIYIMSVIALTYSRFEWIMKFFPLFNLGLARFQYMVMGVASYFIILNFWQYSKKVSKIQKQLVIFNSKYQEQESKIRHAVSEHTRLSQQQPFLEPILEVLSRAYRVQLQSDVFAKVNATTEFDVKTLPACVTLARANDAEESKMARLKQRALSVLMTPGWRTRGLNDIAKVHAESKMLDAAMLSLSSLDTDSMISASNSQRLLLEAFSNTSIHQKVSQKRLVRAIEEIHQEVLANFNSEDRPRVISLRDDGFNKIAFRTSWLADNDVSEEWIPFLSEILSDETAPFGLFNMNLQVRRSELTNSNEIKSVAVVPKYFSTTSNNLRIEKAPTSEVMPLDIVVRVDVSPWADPSAFAVFADDTNKNISLDSESKHQHDSPIGGLTGA